MTRNGNECFSCGARNPRVFYEVENIPVHSCQLMRSPEEARSIGRGDLRLTFCESCGFIQNSLFDATVHDYGARYEESQAFSATFHQFAERLARDLVVKHDLHNKRILEIGCGKGDFLVSLCELGNNSGIGIDPSYLSERTTSEVKERIEFIKDFYSEQYLNLQADMICCRHTLEHIQPTRDFMRLVRRAVEEKKDTSVVFELPDVERVLEEQAFWDIYYEHCSYFSLGSLARLFRSCGFKVDSLAKAFDDQYLLIEARASEGASPTLPARADDMDALRSAVARFELECPKKLSAWRRTFEEIKARGQRAVLWGAGSKAVAFLTTLKVGEECAAVIDINPHKQGTFTPGTGHPIEPPSFLGEYRPDVVVVMNPIYEKEIGADLAGRGLRPRLLTAA